MDLLDLIFPKKCVNCKKLGSYLCSDCFSYLSFNARNVCAVCNKSAFFGLTHPACLDRYSIDGIFSSICYKGVVKRLIYNFKYNPYISSLKNVLIDLFYEGIIQKEEFNNVYRLQPILVPVPLFSSRLKKRGYNHAGILAKGLAKKLNLKAFDLLIKVKNTHPQVGLLQKDRRKNISKAFELKKEGRDIVKGTIVLLVDDVFTTGSTLIEAAKILKKNGAKSVFGITLASP